MAPNITSFRFSAIGVAALALAACGSEAPESTAPASPEPAPAAEAAPPATPTPPEPEVIEVAATNEDLSSDSTDTESSHDHGDESHDHGGEHSDGDHSHEDHGDEAHDHDHGGDDHDHDHAGGAPHVHGKAEGAMILEGSTLTLSLDSALASFGLKETAPANDEEQAVRDAVFDALNRAETVVRLTPEAGCVLMESRQSVRNVGDVGNAVLDYTFECADPAALTDATFMIFEVHETLETIDLAVLIGPTQDAATLSASSPNVPLPQP
ncbi:MAG: DUF2796 domain-containing protein [Pseudomonadota bacterium]